MPDADDRRLVTPSGTGKRLQVQHGATAIREAPTKTARLATEALHGETLIAFDQQDGFVRVQCRRDRYVGWADAAALADFGAAISHRVHSLRTHAYAEPDLKSLPLQTLSLGARVSVIASEGDWRHCDGAGWVHARHLVRHDTLESDPVEIAERFLGTPYLWGGRQSLGLDCTGLTQQAFESAGILLPRDSDMQFAWCGEPVPDWQVQGALARGDLVFWKGHVGIMTDAEHMLHANAWHMAVAHEPLDAAIARIANYYAEPIGAKTRTWR